MAFSAASFVFFGAGCLASKLLKIEFHRYGINRYRITIGILQLLAAIGLVAGFWIPWAAIIASAGLTLLMFLGVCVRLKIRDSALQTAPAFLYMLLNGWILTSLLS